MYFYSASCFHDFSRSAVPCPPALVWIEEPAAGNCSVMWSEVSWVDYYIAYVKRDDGLEEQCNTTGTACKFNCICGYTYLTTVFANNQAGSSPPGQVLNYTTSVYQTHISKCCTSTTDLCL